MNPRFRTAIASDVDHDDLVGEIYFDDQIVCVLTRGRHPGAIDLELVPKGNRESWVFELSEIEEVLDEVKERLVELWGTRAKSSN